MERNMYLPGGILYLGYFRIGYINNVDVTAFY